MGYSTNFFGQFVFDKPLSPLAHQKLKELAEYDLIPWEKQSYPSDGRPLSDCQWVLTQDLKGIEWDGTEKFRRYIEWLEWIIETIFKPDEVTLLGSVRYEGDDPDDLGFIVVESNVVKKLRGIVVPEVTFQELQEFQNFVINSPYGKELLEQWSQKTKTDLD